MGSLCEYRDVALLSQGSKYMNDDTRDDEKQAKLVFIAYGLVFGCVFHDWSSLSISAHSSRARMRASVGS